MLQPDCRTADFCRISEMSRMAPCCACHMFKRLSSQSHVSVLQVFPTYLVAGLGMVAAGLVLNQVE